MDFRERQAPARPRAHRLQGPFYQRLRVELQLGYAVFSAFRQIEGCAGLLFGVQSPHASHADILAHLQPLLSQGVVLDSTAQHALAEQELRQQDEEAQEDDDEHVAAGAHLQQLQRHQEQQEGDAGFLPDQRRRRDPGRR